MILHYTGIFCIGIIIGFLGGLFGKGGSAIATPMLHLMGVPGFIAVASPLPATVPGTLIASVEYRKLGLIDWQVVSWSIYAGIPAAVAGSYLTLYTGSVPLLVLTGLLVLFFGLSFIFFPDTEKNDEDEAMEATKDQRPSYRLFRLIIVALFAGFVSGMLANSGGFLLAPAYARILKLPIKKAFACSLAVSIFLALPGTVVHAYLGHVDWLVTLILAAGSVPSSFYGAKVAIKARSNRLEFGYGIVLLGLGVLFLINLL